MFNAPTYLSKELIDSICLVLNMPGACQLQHRQSTDRTEPPESIPTNEAGEGGGEEWDIDITYLYLHRLCATQL